MFRADSVEEELLALQELRVKEAATAVQLRFELVKHQEALERCRQEQVSLAWKSGGLYFTRQVKEVSQLQNVSRADLARAKQQQATANEYMRAGAYLHCGVLGGGGGGQG